ncbi:MAG TPA: alpha/beta fold hydrolase [Phycisphaerales bacterium]|nr:alpha/beta fold hydrolase [Phycisphaerales bacterium]
MPTPPLSLSRRLARTAAITLALCLGLAMVGRWTGAVEAFAFYHPRSTQHGPHPGFEDVTIRTPDGRELHAWFMPARGLDGASGGKAPAVVHCHGNMGDISEHAGTCAYITRAGVSVLCFDYRGFGRSTPCSYLSREDLVTDTQAAYDYLRARPDVDAARIGVMGYSLGGAFAMDLAARHPEIRCVATVGAFSSWTGIASDFVPVLGGLLIRGGVAADDNAALLGIRPLLVVHGEKDTIVPRVNGERIVRAARAAGVPAELLSVPKGGHLDIFSKDVKGRIAEFFGKHLGTAR